MGIKDFENAGQHHPEVGVFETDPMCRHTNLDDDEVDFFGTPLNKVLESFPDVPLSYILATIEAVNNEIFSIELQGDDLEVARSSVAAMMLGAYNLAPPNEDIDGDASQNTMVSTLKESEAPKRFWKTDGDSRFGLGLVYFGLAGLTADNGSLSLTLATLGVASLFKDENIRNGNGNPKGLFRRFSEAVNTGWQYPEATHYRDGQGLVRKKTYPAIESDREAKTRTDNSEKRETRLGKMLDWLYNPAVDRVFGREYGGKVVHVGHPRQTQIEEDNVRILEASHDVVTGDEQSH